jgi:predicted DCC family thiol-disulfide oxidoreductase YuxK
VNALPEIADRLLVIYDGRCGFCNGAVRWFLRRDRKDRLRFAASQSPLVVGLMHRHQVDTLETPDGPGSLLVIRYVGQPREEVLARSTGVLALLAELPAPWPAFAALLRLAPTPLRDAVYGMVARNRYRFAGRLAECPLPTPSERARFL